MTQGLRITRITAFAARVPVLAPVVTSFGTMHNRPGVFVRIEDADGAFGWGEAFANWPAAGAEHRVNLLMDDVADLVLGQTFAGPEAMFHALTRATRIRALQCGEPGPFRQATAALDIAAWDLTARRAGLPLAQMLSPQATAQVPAYASGIHINTAASEIPRARAMGFNAFKVKVGFDCSADPQKVLAQAEKLRRGERLFADANQAWDRSSAQHFIDTVSSANLGWLEEPIPADAPDADWQALANGAVPLAGGENIAGDADFDHAIALGALRYFQPDVAKWGGVTRCFSVARRALAAGHIYCPHFLGGGIGLAASAHVLAAAGGPGLLEVDINPNPLRDAFGDIGQFMTQGAWQIGAAAGLGVTDLPADLRAHVTLTRSTG